MAIDATLRLRLSMLSAYSRGVNAICADLVRSEIWAIPLVKSVTDAHRIDR
jgi:hypothetical protein